MQASKGRLGGARGRRVIAAGLVVAFAGLASACGDTPTDALSQESTTTTTTTSEADFSVIFGDLTEGLGLTDDQLSAVNDVMDNYRGAAREPGSLWYAAADLQDVLSSEQVATLQARLAERRSDTSSRRGQANSGARRGSSRRGEGGLHGAAEALDLSEEQLAQLEEIRDSYAAPLEEIREAVRDGSITREDAKIRLETIREATREAMLGILTAEQVALLDEQMAERQARREEARANRDEMSGQRVERRQAERAAMVEALGLTVEQVEAIEALGERASGEERPSREEMESSRAERHEALLAILDADQEEIWVLHASLAESAARHRRDGQRGDREGRRSTARS